MSAEPIVETRRAVVLLRLGVGIEEIDLPEGATLADVLQAAGVDPSDGEILIDGKPPAESLAMRPGAIVSVGPKPTQPAGPPPWVSTIGMFRDDPTFEAFVNDVRKARDAERDEP